jgi:hypothetical protein
MGDELVFKKLMEDLVCDNRKKEKVLIERNGSLKGRTI